MPAKWLGRCGWSVVSFPDARPHDSFEARGQKLTEWCDKNAKDFDLVVASRSSSTSYIGFLCQMRKYNGKPLVMDFDDHFLGVPSYNTGFATNHPGSTVAKAASIQLAASDASTTTTDHMLRLYSNKSPDMRVLPNCIDPDDWQGHCTDPARKDDASIRIVFAGGSGRYGDLLECKEAVERVMDEYPAIRLFFVGCFPDWAAKWCADKRDPANNRAFAVRWAPFRHFQRMLVWGGFDIALAPLEHNDFNLCKSNLKYLDYGMAGIPGVYSRIDTYSDVKHNHTGMIAGSPDEWYLSLKALIADRELRHHIAQQAKQHVLANYNIEDRIGLWEKAYEDFASLTPNIEAKAWQGQYQQVAQDSPSPVAARL